MRNNMDFGKIPSEFYGEAPDGSKKISRILLGTASAPYANGAEQNALLDEMFASGITAYDTARVYGGAEECLGNWMASRKNRDKVWIETKCGHPDASGHKRVNEQAMRRDLETSLAALKTDYVDALLLHRDDEDVPVSEITEIFNMFYREGKVRAFGVSNWNHLRISEANDYAAAHGLRPFTFSSPCFSLADMVGDPWGGCVSLSGEKKCRGARLVQAVADTGHRIRFPRERALFRKSVGCGKRGCLYGCRRALRLRLRSKLCPGKKVRRACPRKRHDGGAGRPRLDIQTGLECLCRHRHIKPGAYAGKHCRLFVRFDQRRMRLAQRPIRKETAPGGLPSF